MTSFAISRNLCASEAAFANFFSISSKTPKLSSKLLAFALTLVFTMICVASDSFAAKPCTTTTDCRGHAEGTQCVTIAGGVPSAFAVGGAGGANGQCGCANNYENYNSNATSSDCLAPAPYCDRGTCTSVTSAVGNLLDDTNSDNVSNNKLVKVLCNAYAMIIGTGGKTLAAFAIISAGIGFFTGKVSWGLLIGIAAGIGAMFGAPSIVAAISGDAVDVRCRALVK